MTLYFEILKFLNLCLSNLLIEYINVGEYLNASIVDYLEDFKTCNLQEQKLSKVLLIDTI